MILQILGIAILGFSLGMFNSFVRFPITQLSPDITMIFLSVVVAKNNNSLISLLSGFLIGLGLDLISLAPLGFYAFIFCLIGYVSSQLYPLIHFGRVLLAACMGIIATFLKYFFSWLISSVFTVTYGEPEVIFSSRFLWELIINTAISPFVFILFDFFINLFGGRRRGFR